MRRVDLLRGDRPWRIDLRTSPPVSARQRAYGALGALLLIVSAYEAPTGLWALLAACLAWIWFRPSFWLTGGGRPPLATSEWLEWNAHLALSAAEQEHAQKEAEAKAKARGR